MSCYLVLGSGGSTHHFHKLLKETLSGSGQGGLSDDLRARIPDNLGHLSCDITLLFGPSEDQYYNILVARPSLQAEGKIVGKDHPRLFQNCFNNKTFRIPWVILLLSVIYVQYLK